MILNVEVPLNPLSFGNCSVNILYSLYKQGIRAHIFPMGKIDLDSFDKLPDDFKKWLEEGINRALLDYSAQNPSFKLWHCNGSQNKIADKQFLFTFHETDSLTPYEVNLLNNQAGVFVSNLFSKEVFEKHGVKNVSYIPLGFDSLHYHRLDKRMVPASLISFGLLGKWEKRKSTVEVLRAWAKKYGNNPKYMLQAAITNPFWNPEQNAQAQMQALEGKKYHNINFLPFVKTNSEYNQILNAIDIVLGMSKAEGWGLPEFQTVALGKHSVIHDATGYKSWATPDNSTLVESSGKEAVYDGLFFHPNQPFSQGSYFTWNEESFLSACDIAEKKYLTEPVNDAGLSLQGDFTWERTAKEILNKL